MAVGIEARTRQQRIHLAAQIRDGAGRARVGGRGEQADDAEFAGQIAVRVEALDADVIEIDAPVHARTHIGLRDDEGFRLIQKLPDFRRHHDGLSAAPQNLHVAAAQQTKAGFVLGFNLALLAVKGIFAHAEKREIICD